MALAACVVTVYAQSGEAVNSLEKTELCIEDSKCNHHLCCLSVEDGLATQPGSILPISKTIQHIDGWAVSLVTHCYHCDCSHVCTEVALPCNRLALVPWNSGAGNRDRSGRLSIHGRPIHIYTTNRDIRHDCLGYTRIA